MATLCACGRALHYTNAATEALIQGAIDTLGPTVAVTTRSGTWDVPRHYYALHGIIVRELPTVARRYQWTVQRLVARRRRNSG
jgi:hypothetical protein